MAATCSPTPRGRSPTRARRSSTAPGPSSPTRSCDRCSVRSSTSSTALFARFDAPPGGQYNGWYQYFDRDIDKLLKIKQPQPFTNDYCGAGNLKRCQSSLWDALAAAGKQLTKKYGTSNPSAWHASAKPIEINFAPLPLITMQYTNRPSGIQQVISFNRHR